MTVPHPQYSEQSGKQETDYFRRLYSEEMDTSEAPPRLRYAILAQGRTGSELIAAYLRRRGIGIPLEYFHEGSLPLLAARWGCLEAGGLVDMLRYCDELERYRTTPSGAFGIKIIVPHLNRVTSANTDAAMTILDRFDKILLTRRRDTLRQAISLMRAMSTGQWHVLPGDDRKPMPSPDLRLTFARITYCWAQIISQEREMALLEAKLPAGKLRTVWYEDLSDPRAMPGIVDWLCAGSSVLPRPEAPDHSLPIKGDSREAETIEKAYRDYIAVKPF